MTELQRVGGPPSRFDRNLGRDPRGHRRRRPARDRQAVGRRRRAGSADRDARAHAVAEPDARRRPSTASRATTSPTSGSSSRRRLGGLVGRQPRLLLVRASDRPGAGARVRRAPRGGGRRQAGRPRPAGRPPSAAGRHQPSPTSATSRSRRSGPSSGSPPAATSSSSPINRPLGQTVDVIRLVRVGRRRQRDRRPGGADRLAVAEPLHGHRPRRPGTGRGDAAVAGRALPAGARDRPGRGRPVARDRRRHAADRGARHRPRRPPPRRRPADDEMDLGLTALARSSAAAAAASAARSPTVLRPRGARSGWSPGRATGSMPRAAAARRARGPGRPRDTGRARGGRRRGRRRVRRPRPARRQLRRPAAGSVRGPRRGGLAARHRRHAVERRSGCCAPPCRTCARVATRPSWSSCRARSASRSPA